MTCPLLTMGQAAVTKKREEPVCRTDALYARVAVAVTSARGQRPGWLADGRRGKRMTSMLGEEACSPTSLLAFVALQSEASLGVFFMSAGSVLRRQRSYQRRQGLLVA